MSAAILALAVLACSATPAPTGAVRPGTPDAPRRVSVILEDYSFVPTPIDLVPGETVRFFVINGGLVTHELVLGPPSVQDAWERADAATAPPVFGATPPPASVPPDAPGVRVLLGSGQSTSFTYRVPTDAPPLLECHLPGHIERGMVGAIRFISPGGATSPAPARAP